MTLDDLEKVVVGHDGKGAGAGWYLEKIFVKESSDPNNKEYYFPCDR